MLFSGLEILINDRTLCSKYNFKRWTIESIQRRISGPRQKHSGAELSGFQVALLSSERFRLFISLIFFIIIKFVYTFFFLLQSRSTYRMD